MDAKLIAQTFKELSHHIECSESGLCSVPRDVLQRARALLYYVPSDAAQAPQGWIACADRLPKESEHRRVLIYTDGYDFGGEQFFDVEADSLNECSYSDPEGQPEECRVASHWMPHPYPRAAPVAPAAAAPSTEIPGATAALRKLLDSSNDYGSLIEFSYSPEWQAASEVLARPAEAVPTHLRGGTVIDDSVVKRLAAKFCFLPTDETEQADEHEKVTRDLLIYGSGFMRDGQHIPFAAAVEQPDARDAFIRKIAAQTPEQPDYWSECGQCRHNAEDAQDLLDSAAAPQVTVKGDDHYQQLLGVAYVVLGCLAANGVDIPVRFLDAFADPDSVENPLELLPCDFSPSQAVSAAMPQDKLECAASKQGSAGGNDPAECDWPLCGCDPKATEVIAALQECDLLKDRSAPQAKPIYQIGANAGGGIAWWDVDKDRYEREKKTGYMKTGIVYREVT